MACATPGRRPVTTHEEPKRPRSPVCSSDHAQADRLLELLRRERTAKGAARVALSRELATELAHAREAILACAMVSAEREFGLTARYPLLLPRHVESEMRAHLTKSSTTKKGRKA
jgi:hypothetical protein